MNDGMNVKAPDDFVTHAEVGHGTDEPDVLPGKQVHEVVLRLQEQNRHLAAVTIRGWRIEGPVQLDLLGLRGQPLPRLVFADCRDLALSAQGARLGALGILNSTLSALDLADAVIEGPLAITDCSFTDGSDVRFIRLHLAGSRAQSLTIQSLDGGQDALTVELNLSGARIERALTIERVRLNGPLVLERTSVGADTTISASRFQQQLVQAVSARAVTTSGNLTFQRLETDGTVNLADARIGGDLYFDDCEIAPTFGDAILLADSAVRGMLRVNGGTLTGTIRLGTSTINGSLLVNSVSISPTEGPALSVLGGTIGAEAGVTGLTPSGAIVFRYATIGLRLGISDTVIGGESQFPIDIQNNKIGGGLDLARLTYAGYGTLRGCTIGSGLSIGAITLNPWPIDGERSLFNCNFLVTDNEVKGMVTLGKLESEDEEARALVELRNTRAGSINVLGCSDHESVNVNLNGLEYSKIDHLTGYSARFMRQLIERNEARKYNFAKAEWQGEIDRMKSWGEIRHRRPMFYPPQPQAHMQLARVLTSEGWDEEAEKVMVSMRRSTRFAGAFLKPLTYIISRLFDLCFGYGYSKWRALLTLTLWICLGWYGVNAALNAGVMVVDVQAVSTGGGPLARWATVSSPPEPPCKGQIEPLFYAIDLAIPLLDLGQARKCTIKLDDAEEGLPVWQKTTTRWWLFRYLYELFGGIIISLAALTFTGTLKTKL